MLVFTIKDVVGVLLLTIAGVIWLAHLAKQYFCKHEEYWENGSCDAICHKCGKNLGFIGEVRKMRQNEAAKMDSSL